MKTNKIPAMLLSAAIACTPVLTSAAQIVASAEETTTATTTATTAAAEAAVAVPVAVDPAAVVVAANPTSGTTATQAPANTTATQNNNSASTTAATTAATTVPQKVADAAVVSKDVDNNWAAGNAMAKGMAVVVNNPNENEYDSFSVSSIIRKRVTSNNPIFNPYDNIYSFRMPDANQGKMLYTPNPRWFINTPSPAVVGGSGESGTITWDPVPMADGYRYTIRTYAIDDSADSHDYSFQHTHRTNFSGNTLSPKAVGVDDASGAKAGDVLTGDGEGILTDSAKEKITTETYDVDRFPTKFRVKEDFSVNAKWQEQDATTNYTIKENWKEFTDLDKNLVVGYTYNLEKPSITVSADVPVRVEVMIQAFRIDNKTGELYNLSAVSEPRVVDLNWVAKESWEGMLGAPDQYEDEFFRAEYHKLDVPTPPENYKVDWKTVTLPVTKKMVDDGLYTLGSSTYGGVTYNEEIDPISGYVVEHASDIDNPRASSAQKTLDNIKQVKYATFKMLLDAKGDPVLTAAGGYQGDPVYLTETFDLKNKPTAKEYDTSDDLKMSGDEGARRWALNKSIIQAEKDNVKRWEAAYAEWKKQELDPIEKWNKDHEDQINKAWRTAYKEAIKAYAASEFPNNKSLSMRYGLLDLDRNGIPELIVSFSSKADKNSYIVLDFQTDRAKLRTVHDKYRTEWYYEDVLGACAKRGRCFKLDNLAPIDSWTAADDEKDPLATTTSSSSSSASSSASSSSGSSSSSSSSSSTDAGAPKTGDAGVAGLVAAAAAAVAGIFASRRKKD